jgi:hypothetical protein
MLRLVRSPRLARVVCITIALVTLGGCSSERLAGWYATRKLDEYLDLDGDQEKRLRQRVDAALAEVRRDTLPAWIALLREGRGQMAVHPTEAQIARAQDRYDQILDAAVAQLVPHLAPVLAELDDAQIDHFVRKLRARLDDNFEEQLVSGDARRKKLDAHVVDGLEDVIGDLDKQQRQTILAAVHALPDDRALQYRIDRQTLADFQRFLHARRRDPQRERSDAIAHELRRMWAVRYSELGPARDRETRLAEQRKLLLTISETMTPKQRARGVATIDGHIATAKKFALPEAASALPTRAEARASTSR